MKINWILPEVSQCGGVRVALQYANAFTEMGHDVICYAPKSGQHFGWKKIFFLKEVLRMRREEELRGEWFENEFEFEFPMWITDDYIRDADITIATSWITSYWVKNLAQSKGKKIYFIQDFETWGDSTYNDRVLKSYTFPFDICITVSTALHDRVLQEIGRDSKVICNGVEECFLRETDKSLNTITLGMPYRESRGDDIKNCALGIRVLQKVMEKYPEIRVISFGFKKPDDWDEKIRFLENPNREKLVEFYNECNIFYVPSIYEGWGLPAMEAMAQENAVLASYSGLIKEIGVDGENCLILQNPKDEQETFDKISSLIQNRNDIEKIGNCARTVISEMSNKKSAQKFEKVLLDVVNL